MSTTERRERKRPFISFLPPRLYLFFPGGPSIFVWWLCRKCFSHGGATLAPRLAPNRPHSVLRVLARQAILCCVC